MRTFAATCAELASFGRAVKVWAKTFWDASNNALFLVSLNLPNQEVQSRTSQ